VPAFFIVGTADDELASSLVDQLVRGRIAGHERFTAPDQLVNEINESTEQEASSA